MTAVDTKTIIVNLLKEDEKTYLPISRLQKLLGFIYLELRKKSKLEEYIMSFDINFDAIQRTVLYNHNIFELDIDGETIYLRHSRQIERLTKQYQADSIILDIIKAFKQTDAA